MSSKKIILIIAILCNLITISMEKPLHQSSYKEQNILELFSFNSVNLNAVPAIKKTIANFILNEKQWWYLDTIFSHPKAVTAVCFNNANTLLATGSKDKKAYVFDITTKKIISFFQHAACVNSVCFNNTGILLATGSDDYKTRIFTINPANLYMSIQHAHKVSSVCFNPTGTQIAIGEKGYTIYISDISNINRETRSHWVNSSVKSINFDPTGKFLAVTTHDDLHIINLHDNKNIILNNFNNANFSCFDHSGQHLAIASPLFQAKIFNMNTKKETTSIEHHQSVHTVLFDSSGKYLITRAIDNIIRIFDIRTHQKVASFSPKNTILSMCIGLSKNLIAIGTNGDNEALIFAPHTAWTLEQILLKKIFNTWLLIEKPNKNITSSKKLLKDIALKFQLQIEELHNVWNSFPLKMQAALWRSIHDKIEQYGKKIENCIVS